MDKDIATEIANDWLELAENDDALSRQYSGLRRSLWELLPEAEGAGVIIDGSASVLAVDDDALFIVQFDVASGSRPRLVVERLPLVPGEVLIRRTDQPDGQVPGRPSELAYTVLWELTWPAGRVIAFETILRRNDGFNPGPSRSDAVAGRICRQLGWGAAK